MSFKFHGRIQGAEARSGEALVLLGTGVVTRQIILLVREEGAMEMTVEVSVGMSRGSVLYVVFAGFRYPGRQVS